MSAGVRRSLGILGLLVGLAVVGLPLAGEVLERQVLSVRVAGEFQHVDRARLEAKVRPELEGRGFFNLDVERVRVAATSLPWVREATVRRVWPDSIHIAVVERVAVARWNDDALMEDDGQVFVPREDLSPYRLARLEGPSGHEAELLARYKQLAVGFGALAGGVSRVSLSDQGQWEIAFSNGMTLVPSTPLDVPALMELVRELPAILGDRLEEVERIDLRYANGFAVRWRETQASPEGGNG